MSTLSSLYPQLFPLGPPRLPQLPPQLPMDHPSLSKSEPASPAQPAPAATNTTTPAEPHDPPKTAAGQSSTSESFPCGWKDCTRSFSDADSLYNHLCNDHIGRKSTNNLCLTCLWKDCGTTCAKRDHITSHLRGTSLSYSSRPIPSSLSHSPHSSQAAQLRDL